MPVALSGAVMPSGLEIKKAKLRGAQSNGMICSSVELGLVKTNDGIMPLDESIGELKLKLSQPHKRFQHELNISVYNAYARKNPWTIYFVKDKDNPNKLQGKMMYLFSIVPSVSWNFHF